MAHKCSPSHTCVLTSSPTSEVFTPLEVCLKTDGLKVLLHLFTVSSLKTQREALELHQTLRLHGKEAAAQIRQGTANHISQAIPHPATLTPTPVSSTGVTYLSLHMPSSEPSRRVAFVHSTAEPHGSYKSQVHVRKEETVKLA